MLRLHCSDLWVHLPKLAKSSRRRQAAVAYVSDDSAVRFRSGDTLVVDASDAVIRGGLTSAKVLNRAFRSGAEIFSCPNLHAKVYVFDRTAVIGSSNTSASSADRLLEAAVITDSPSIASAARKLIGELRDKSQRLDETEIRRLMRIKVVRRFPIGATGHRAPKINPKPGATWLAAVHELDLSRYTREESYAERGQEKAEERLLKSSSEADWTRFSKNSNIARKAHVDDWLIRMWQTKLDGRVTKVLRRAPIRYIQKEPTCVRIYIEDFKNSEAESLRWSVFKKIAEDAGIPNRRLGKRSIGVLRDNEAEALDSLWRAQLDGSRK